MAGLEDAEDRCLALMDELSFTRDLILSIAKEIRRNPKLGDQWDSVFSSDTANAINDIMSGGFLTKGMEVL